MIINLFQLAGDVVRLPAEHVENKRRRFIQRHRAGVRENHIFRAQRITGGEFGIRLQFNGQGFRRRIGLPAFGEDRYDFFRVVAVGLHQTLIEAGDRLNAGEFVRFRRVEADDVVETRATTSVLGGVAACAAAESADSSSKGNSFLVMCNP